MRNIFVSSMVLLTASAAKAQDAGTVSLDATDFTLTLARGDGDVLTPDELATYFSRARCACPTNLVAELTLDSTAAAKLGGHNVDAQFMVGNDCDNAQVTGCVSVGSSVTLSSGKTSTSASVMTSAIFEAASRADCGGGSTTSTRFWAIVRLDGARLATEPSLALTLGGAGPSAPTDIETVTADQGLLVSWKPSGDAATLQGHQVLCSPAPANASTARYDTCGVSVPDGGAGPFDSFDPQFVCSDLVAAGTHSTRVHGLENGRPYQVAVVAVGVDGTPSAPSALADGTPAPTVGFGDLYKQVGGTAEGGCAVGGSGSGGETLSLAGTAGLGLVFALVGAWRRRPPRSGTLLLIFVAAIGLGTSQRSAAATLDDAPALPALASPRRWNVELRFAPYRPNVDSEFADRGDTSRPFQQVFSSARHLMMQLEIDRHFSHRGGTWADGLGAGYYRVTAAALSGDLQARSGDDTALRLIPLSAVFVYRADSLRQRFSSPLVPYAKAGLDCALWRISDTSQANINGRTLGWHAAAGVTINLSSLDPDAAEAMDRESGVNQTALFVEAAHYRLDGFGARRALRVGDTTWFAGLMLEL